jgi:hypothetical protein
MKKNIIIASFLLFLISCEANGDLTRDTVQNNPIPETTPVSASGIFLGTSGITVKGNAKIYLDNNVYKVLLENFSIESGPDLKVYLSKTATPSNIVNLGNLTSAAVYPIPTQVIVSEYNYILIHCQQYNHLFAVAQLTKN